ncbi:MAG: fumarylacetoacetate hydrolase family protein [Alphaproteobacteria bacterium]|nr:fumarylacetoacetate hydrolase family protein [Alphaproteobacteria bacterium]
MKLGSLKIGGRDGTLLVISDDFSRAAPAIGIAATLQTVLENWDEAAPLLSALADQVNAGTAPGLAPFDPTAMASPLPRAYAWLDGSAYVGHMELVRKARGVALPPSFWTDPLMYQGGSDGFLSPTDPILVESEDWGIDFEGEVAVVVDDVPFGVSAIDAAAHIKLVMLVNDVSLRGLIPAELAKGFGFVHGKPPTAFAPAAVTPDALGDAWDGRKLHLPLLSYLNDEKVGCTEAGVDMTFDFPTLISHAAKTRPLTAGTVIGSGTVSNADQTHGYSCIAEIRMIETIANGAPKTPFMSFGDRVRLEILDKSGASIFGTIDQVVEQA